MADRFPNFSDSPLSPARAPFAIVPDDETELPTIPKAIQSNATGWVVLRGIDATEDTPVYVVPGQVIDMRARYVRATGTSLTLADGAPVGAAELVGLA